MKIASRLFMALSLLTVLGLLVQCGDAGDLLGKVEERVAEAQTEQNPGPFPEIQISQNSTLISSGGDYTINSTVVGTPIDVVFSIENSGDAALTLTGSPNLVSLSSSADFSIVTQPVSSIASGSNSDFTLRFDPSDAGAKSVIVNIANDDPDEPLYSFTVNSSATGTPEPEINLKQGTTNITSGGSYPSMGSVAVGSYRDVTFTIENIGTADLLLDGSPALVSLDSTTNFSLTEQPSQSTISTSSNTTFALRFSPQSGGPKSVTVTIPNDDSDEDPYTFTASGTGLVPEINISRGGTNISSGGSINIGNYAVGTANAIGFVIENTGGAELLFTGTPNKVSLIGSTDFSVITDPPDSIAAGGNDTFALLFEPQSSGSKSVTLSIPNNDSNEDPYTINVTGTGIIPDIQVSEGAVINNNSSYSFPDTMLGESSSAVFTIENLGASDLNLTGTPFVELSGVAASMFTITAQPVSPISPSGSTTFNLQFEPSESGSQTATLTIPNNDPDESPFIFYPGGEATPWHGLQTVDTGPYQDGPYSSIAMDGDSLYISYWAMGTGGYDTMKLAKSTNGGLDWSFTTLPVSYVWKRHRNQQIAVDGNNIFIAMKAAYPQGYSIEQLHLCYSSDGGETWDVMEELSDVIENDTDIAITLDGSYVYIAYSNSVAGDNGIYLERIPYDCSSSSTYAVDASSYGENISVTNDGTTVYLSSPSNMDDDFRLYKASKTNLSSWTETVIDSDTSSQKFDSNSVAVYNGDIYVSYIHEIDSNNRDLVCAKSTDGGTTWNNVSIDSTCAEYYFEYFADMSIDGSDIYISYYDYTDDNKPALSIAKSTNAGDSWSTSIIDDAPVARGVFNAIVASGGTICISYTDSDGYTELLFAKSIDGGVTW